MIFPFSLLIVTVCIPMVLADPTVEQVTICPSEPPPLSTILFNATILGNESIDEVRLLAQECQQDICYVDRWNESMNKTDDVYQATITLVPKTATQIKYHIAIKSNEIWFNSETAFFNLSIDEQNNPPENNPGNNSTPGFEPVLFLFSVGFMMFIRRKSLKGKNKR